MEKKPDNPQAFPNTYDSGMTLRDYFAGQALVAVAKDRSTCKVGWQKDLAWAAYSMADAMLRERAK